MEQCRDQPDRAEQHYRFGKARNRFTGCSCALKGQFGSNPGRQHCADTRNLDLVFHSSLSGVGAHWSKEVHVYYVGSHRRQVLVVSHDGNGEFLMQPDIGNILRVGNIREVRIWAPHVFKNDVSLKSLPLGEHVFRMDSKFTF